MLHDEIDIYRRTNNTSEKIKPKDCIFVVDGGGGCSIKYLRNSQIKHNWNRQYFFLRSFIGNDIRSNIEINSYSLWVRRKEMFDD